MALVYLKLPFSKTSSFVNKRSAESLFFKFYSKFDNLSNSSEKPIKIHKRILMKNLQGQVKYFVEKRYMYFEKNSHHEDWNPGSVDYKI